MASRIDNLRAAYHILARDVQRSLRTQLGDTARLQEQQHHALAFLHAAEQHIALFPPDEYTVLQHSITEMVQSLDNAQQQSSDPPDAAPLVVSHQAKSGQRGRPRVEINTAFLQQALELRGPTHIAPVLGCSSRTIRRRALEAGLVAPGAPVFQEEHHPDGQVTRLHTSTTRPMAMLDDQELDRFIYQILEVFPAFGRQMLFGRLKAAGFHVSRERITQSYLRVHGTPGRFGDRTIHRRAYAVAGANSLWHHDGQHGLIRFKIVKHCFIDGKSRLVAGIRASNNNRATTVFSLFEEAKDIHGTPSRVRGDHGTENVLVAQWMEDHRGVGRGSYIWGRSVHNTRIERLWYDVTHGFGKKWKDFFISLEASHGLNPSVPEHIWLLHHLFLSAIDRDAQEWAEAWNSHQLQIRGERSRSPRDMFLFSLLQDGPRGIHTQLNPPEDHVENIAAYV